MVFKCQGLWPVLWRLLHREKKEAELQMDETELWPDQRGIVRPQEDDWRSSIRSADLCSQRYWCVQAQRTIQSLHSPRWVARMSALGSLSTGLWAVRLHFIQQPCSNSGRNFKVWADDSACAIRPWDPRYAAVMPHTHHPKHSDCDLH